MTLKLIVAIATISFVAISLFKHLTNDSAPSLSYTCSVQLIGAVVIAISLTPLLWAIETYKWRIAVKNFEPTHWLHALKTIWYGTGVGLLTPNRIGDPLGRMVMVQPRHRVRAVEAAMLCAATQQLATIVYGAFGLSLWHDISFLHPNGIVVTTILIAFAIPIAVIAAIIMVPKRISKLRWIKRISKDEPLSPNISRGRLFTIILMSFARYAIFSTQLLILLIGFGFNGSVLNGYLAIFIMYLIASTLPSLAITEAGVRAGVGIVVIGSIWENPLGIATATLLLWLLNVAIPGMLGTWWGYISKEKLDSNQ